jgi:hypothetical protein
MAGLNLQNADGTPWKPEPHTPGPWQEFAESGDYWIAQVIDDGMPGVSICASDDISGGDVDLICAAPDLLLACELALHKIEQTLAGHYPKGQALEAALGPLRATIAKAKGEQL